MERTINTCILAIIGMTFMAQPAAAASNPHIGAQSAYCGYLRDQERRLMEQWYEQCFDDGGVWSDGPCRDLERQLDELDAKIRANCSGASQQPGSTTK